MKLSQSMTDVARKARCYDVAAAAIDGMDVLAVERAARTAAAAVRAGEGPYFLECRTYRFRAHSMFDPELYRTKAEVEEWKQRDPCVLLTARLEEQGLWADADRQAIEQAIAREIDQAVAFAEGGTWEPVEDLTRFVYSDGGEASPQTAER